MSRKPLKPINFAGEDADYLVSSLQSRINHDPSVAKAVRAEYTKMRDIAQKRIKRMGKSEFSESETYTTRKGGFKKLKDISVENLAQALHDVQKFVRSKESRISGQREIQRKTVSTFERQGLQLHKGNYWAFWAVMHEMRARKMIYGSDKALELADEMLSRQMLTNTSGDRDSLKSLESGDFATLLEHSSELKEIPIDIDTTEEMSDYIKEIGW